MNKLIDILQHQHLVWQGSKKAATSTGEPSGYQALDNKLSGGFTLGVTEIQSQQGIGELRLLLPLLKQAFTQGRLVVFIAPQGVISAQALAAQGFELDKVLIVYPDDQQQALWAAEQCLRSGACHSVVTWLSQALEVHQVKRLQVASHTGNSYQFILRVNKAESLSLPFDLSMSLQAHEQGVVARIHKRKQGWPSGDFTIDMTSYWPALTVQAKPDNVVHFPKVKVS